MLNSKYPRISEVILGIIFRKFPILYGHLKTIEDSLDEENFLKNLGFDQE